MTQVLNTFQQQRYIILQTSRRKFSLVYLDDIVIFKSAERPFGPIRTVPPLNRRTSMSPESRRIIRFKYCIDYLRQIVNLSRLAIFEIATITCSLQHPISMTDLWFFSAFARASMVCGKICEHSFPVELQPTKWQTISPWMAKEVLRAS